MTTIRVLVFDWGDTLMRYLPSFGGSPAGAPGTELVPGVVEALAALPSDLIRCVATNASDVDAERLRLALAHGGIAHQFSHLFTPRELGALKPDPRFFRRILETLGVEPVASVMIGDAYANDVCAARAVGMRTIWFCDAPLTRAAPCADRVIRTMADLPAAVASLAEQGSNA